MNFLQFIRISTLIVLVSAAPVKDGNEPTPVVLWHGMSNTCCDGFIGGYKQLIEEQIPGVHVLSLQIGLSLEDDKRNGYVMNVNKQVEIACMEIAGDAKLKNGYHSVGFSQGGQFLRAVAQRCPHPPMKNFISLGGQHQGVYGVPECPPKYNVLCDIARQAFNPIAYADFVQNTSVQAEYWHDPINEDLYRNKSVFLADINNEKVQNDKYKENLLQLETMVLVKFSQDTTVVPAESEWFGFYTPGQATTIQTMNETDLYQQVWHYSVFCQHLQFFDNLFTQYDRIGLKALNEQGKLVLLSVDADHLKFSDQWFIDTIINPYLKT